MSGTQYLPVKIKEAMEADNPAIPGLKAQGRLVESHNEWWYVNPFRDLETQLRQAGLLDPVPVDPIQAQFEEMFGPRPVRGGADLSPEGIEELRRSQTRWDAELERFGGRLAPTALEAYIPEATEDKLTSNDLLGSLYGIFVEFYLWSGQPVVHIVGEPNYPITLAQDWVKYPWFVVTNHQMREIMNGETIPPDKRHPMLPSDTAILSGE